MINKIVELVINFEDLEFDDLGIEIMSLVDRPAIDVNWMAFQEEVEYSKEEEDKILEGFLKLASSDEYGQRITEDSVIIDGTKDKFASVSEIAQGIRALDILEGDQPARKMYRYRGGMQANSRNFCTAMVALNKMYTIEEINTMSRIPFQAGMGEGGSNTYDIFKYKGGVNCGHYWEDLSVFDRSGREVIISNGPAAGDAGEVAKRANNYWRANFWKFSADDQMIITGPAMIPNQMIPRKDDKGNVFHVYFSKETIKLLAKKFLQDNNAHNTDINHNNNVVNENTLLESWIVEDTEMDKAKALGFTLPEGSWMTSYKINNIDTWNDIKEGKLNGFSVTGQFIEKLQS
jgi:hypothetical protein